MALKRGFDFSYPQSTNSSAGPCETDTKSNPLREFFEARTEGPGIWKWDHYFDIYDRHLNRFRGKDVHVLEIGIFSGGSLDMWRDYFGPKASIYGADIDPACKAHERNGVKVFIGDQGDPAFWRNFKREVPILDVVIDDGAHIADLQYVSTEELLPHLRRGGVFLCEDLHDGFNRYTSYVAGLTHKLNATNADNSCTPFQQDIASIHNYPFVTVIEKNSEPVPKYTVDRRGTVWQPVTWDVRKTAR
jgi:hypothetical protein